MQKKKHFNQTIRVVFYYEVVMTDEGEDLHTRIEKIEEKRTIYKI